MTLNQLNVYKMFLNHFTVVYIFTRVINHSLPLLFPLLQFASMARAGMERCGGDFCASPTGTLLPVHSVYSTVDSG